MKLTKDQISLITRKALEKSEEENKKKFEEFCNSKEGKKEIQTFSDEFYDWKSIERILEYSEDNISITISYKYKGSNFQIGINNITSILDVYKADKRSSYTTKFNSLDYMSKQNKSQRIKEYLILKSIDSKDIDVEALIKELSEI